MFIEDKIPDDLMYLKPFASLESVSMSRLARSGTQVLRKLVDREQPMAVQVQGAGAMVAISQRQYDEMVELFHRFRSQSSEDGFTQLLGERFDELMGRMNRPGAAEATHRALFSNPALLNEGYKPGETENHKG